MGTTTRKVGKGQDARLRAEERRVAEARLAAALSTGRPTRFWYDVATRVCSIIGRTGEPPLRAIRSATRLCRAAAVADRTASLAHAGPSVVRVDTGERTLTNGRVFDVGVVERWDPILISGRVRHVVTLRDRFGFRITRIIREPRVAAPEESRARYPELLGEGAAA